MAKWIYVGLLSGAVVAMVLAGFLQAYPIEMFAGTEQTIVLDPARFPIAHRARLSCCVDISGLHLGARADNANAIPELQICFCENGQPLTNDVDHGRIETQPGRYSHWVHHVIFSPRSAGPDATYSIRFLELDRSRWFLDTFARSRFWSWAAAGCLLGLALVGVFDPRWLGGRWSLMLFLGLAGAIAPHVVKFWDQALTTEDSQSYVDNFARPPLYPWFVHVMKGGTAWGPEDFREPRRPIAAPSDALLRVVRAQRVALWVCFLVAVWAASLFACRPLAVMLFFALQHNGMLLPDLETSMMSEPLALAFLCLAVATFCVVAVRRSLWLLPILAATYGCLVLTRSAGVFAIVFLAVAVVVAAIAHWRRKKALAAALASVGLVGLSAIIVLLGNSHARNGIWAMSPLHNWERVAFALQVADVTDLDAMPDGEMRQFLDDALRQRLALKGNVPLEALDLNANCWDIAYPVALGMFAARGATADWRDPPGPHLKFRYVNGLFGRVADVVLARHRDRYLRVVAHSFFTRAAGGHTRLHWRRVSFLWLLALGFAACLIGRNICALAGATCLLAHLGNLIVMSFFELPIQRYVFFSEWVCLLGFLLAVVGCCQRIAGTIASWRLRHALKNETAP
jgi:hypothetical protein